MAVHKKGLIGKFKKKFEMPIRVDTQGISLQVNQDGSAFTTSASHVEDVERLSTHFKTKLNSQKGVRVAINLMAQGRDLVPQIRFVLGPNPEDEAVYEKIETIQLAEPILWKREGRNKFEIDSITYECLVTKIQ